MAREPSPAALLSRMVGCCRIRAQSLARRVVLASNRQTIQPRRFTLTSTPPALQTIVTSWHTEEQDALSPEWWHWIVLGLALTIAESDHAELVLLPADIQSTLRRFSRRVVKTGN